MSSICPKRIQHLSIHPFIQKDPNLLYMSLYIQKTIY